MIDLITSMKRCKPATSVTEDKEKRLAKCLNLIDLVGLGIGSTLGIGIYLLAGAVAKNIAGPAVILSFLIAAVASSLAGLCFAEFGSRAPTAGSVYTYCYITLGEFGAFVMGWNLLQEYVIGAASVAKALSVYIDSFFGYPLEKLFCQFYQIDVPYFANYFDFFALFICVAFSVALAVGLKESVLLNNIVTGLNMLIVLFVTVYGSSYGKISNWMLLKSEIPSSAGTGGFMPFGLEGVIKGAGPCFYGFIGFDCIATTGEEVKNAQKSLPLAIIISLTVVCLSYFAISSVLTLMLPYYLQDELAPLSYAFDANGCHWAKWLIYTGSLFGLYASFFGALYPISRIAYSMSNDGLLFNFFSYIHEKYQTPYFGTIFCGTITGLIAAVFDVNQLINLNSIGTLLSYTMVAACVIILRYSNKNSNLHLEEKKPLLNSKHVPQVNSVFTQLFNYNSQNLPNDLSDSIVTVNVFFYCIFSSLLGFIVSSNLSIKVPVCILLIVLMIMQLISIKRQPEAVDDATFKSPLVPFLPALSILMNIYLMETFDIYTWIRLIVWLLIGFVIYFAYGIFHSKERLNKPNNC